MFDKMIFVIYLNRRSFVNGFLANRDHFSEGATMRNIIGQAVIGEDFFERPKEIKKLWRALGSGSHILISAPRRVGKTSLLLYLRDNPRESYNFIYLITEAVNDENEYYKRICEQIAESGFIRGWEKVSKFAAKTARRMLDKVKGFKFGAAGVDLREGRSVEYRKELIKILESFQMDEQLVIMADEFPQVVENIIENEGERSAIHFLQCHREIRHNPKIKNVQFIYTGSIGLENVVARLNAFNLINDLTPVRIHPLSDKDAEKFIYALLENTDFTLSPAQVKYFIHKVQWLLPFHIQMLINEIDGIHIEDDPDEITNPIIDEALERMLKNKVHFEHWRKRLNKALNPGECTFAVVLLNSLAETSEKKTDEILELARKHKIQDSYKDIISTLVHDGYINNDDDSALYRFNSPLLKSWWFKNVSK